MQHALRTLLEYWLMPEESIYAYAVKSMFNKHPTLSRSPKYFHLIQAEFEKYFTPEGEFLERSPRRTTSALVGEACNAAAEAHSKFMTERWKVRRR